MLVLAKLVRLQPGLRLPYIRRHRNLCGKGQQAHSAHCCAVQRAQRRRRHEVSRRVMKSSGSKSTPLFLGPEDKFHPKRNLVRKRLGILADHRLLDLITEVYREAKRRSPIGTGPVVAVPSPRGIL